jgi:hypothetical protein
VPILAVAMPCFSTEASRLDSMHQNSAGTMHPVNGGYGPVIAVVEGGFESGHK